MDNVLFKVFSTSSDTKIEFLPNEVCLATNFPLVFALVDWDCGFTSEVFAWAFFCTFSFLIGWLSESMDDEEDDEVSDEDLFRSWGWWFWFFFSWFFHASHSLHCHYFLVLVSQRGFLRIHESWKKRKHEETSEIRSSIREKKSSNGSTIYRKENVITLK